MKIRVSMPGKKREGKIQYSKCAQIGTAGPGLWERWKVMVGSHWAAGPLLHICLVFPESCVLQEMEELSIMVFYLLTPRPPSAFDMLTNPFSAW